MTEESNIKFRILKEDSNVKVYGQNPAEVSNCECPPNNPNTCLYCKNGNFSITLLDSGESHCHDEEYNQGKDTKARKKLWLASILCVIFMIGEGVGGYLAGSLAVATDAAHLLTDFAGFMISLFALYIAEKPATKRLSYGYHRAEIIGAMSSVLLIWVITGILVYLAIQRIQSGKYEIDAVIMLITSGIGVIINIIMGCTLHQHSHSHSHHDHSHGGGHSHHNHGSGTHTHDSSTMSKYSGVSLSTTEDLENSTKDSRRSSVSSKSDMSSMDERQNINVRAAFIHVIGDFLQSIGVFIAALVIYFEPQWGIVDPVCTFVFSLLVLATTYAIMKDALNILMEGIPKGINFNEVLDTLMNVKGVLTVHNLRMWSLSMDRLAMSAHLTIDPSATCNANVILRKASNLMKRKYGFSEVTIQIEDFNQKMQNCKKCQDV